MANKFSTRLPSEVLKARLHLLLKDTNDLYNSGNSVLESELVDSYSEALSIFLKSLDGSILKSSSEINSGMPADPSKYNSFTEAIHTDMEILFAETFALDNMIISGFNSINSEREEVLEISKRISNKVGDYLLYSDPKLGAGFFFGDSFNSAERVELGSDLLDTDECYLGKEEGIVLLPLDGEAVKPIIKSIIINKNSNGNPGNEQEVGVVGKVDIAAIRDNEPNTWYEYEKVTAYESDVPLILDLTFVLEDISIINHININPINFGTPTPIEILKIETSKDGQEYRSIKDEIPLKDFVSEEEDNVFSLSPATSNYAGQGFYSFLPRRAQFVHIVFRQNTPYTINTINGERLRYAIGIRDINILARKFKIEGSLISNPFNTDGEIRKISLWASENPDEASTLADVSHYVSEDDGATWRQIQPLERDTQNIPEVINYNNIAEDSIVTDEPVNSLRHKIYLKRDKEAFQGDVVVKRERVERSELVTMPAGNTEILLKNKPIDGSVRMVAPFFGSFSLPNNRQGSGVLGESAPMDLDFLEFKVDIAPVDSLRFELPPIKIPNIKNHIRILVNGEQIEFCEKADISFGINTSYESEWNDSEFDKKTAKIYFLNKNGRELQFRHNDVGFLPPGGARIQICLDGDNPRLELTDKGYIVNLSATSDGFKDNMSLLSIDALSKEEAINKTFRCIAGLDTFRIPVESIGKRDQSQDNNKDSVEITLDRTEKTEVYEADEGLIAPVIDLDQDTWKIEEYLFGLKLTDSTNPNKFYDETPTLFVNGHSEFYDAGVLQEKRWSFDAANGILYLASPCPYAVNVIFRYKENKYTNIPSSGWEFYKSSIDNKINTRKLILDPKYVRTTKRIYQKSGTEDLRSINLLSDNIYQTKEHNWYKQKLIKGTVHIENELFPSGTKPTEVIFVNGYSELNSEVSVVDEEINATSSGGIYSFNLSEINTVNELNEKPGITPVRSKTNISIPTNQFSDNNYIETDNPSTLSDEEWCYVNNEDGTCTVFIKTNTLNKHVAAYTYTINDPGINKDGLYSIDYENGIIHFAQLITKSGNINYQVSTYSAFYNIGNPISDSDIVNIETDNKKIIISDSLSMKLLKNSSALAARPNYLRVVYDSYKESTEKLADLEPYFSPLCKDIAFRSVTADMLEEL